MIQLVYIYTFCSFLYINVFLTEVVLLVAFKIKHKRYGDDVPMSVADLLVELRSYRMGLVQTHHQFKYVRFIA